MPKEYTTHDGWRRASERLIQNTMAAHTVEGETPIVHHFLTGETKKDLREILISFTAYEGGAMHKEEAEKIGLAVIAEWDGEKGEILEDAVERIKHVMELSVAHQKQAAIEAKKRIAKAPWVKADLVWRWDINKGTAHHCFGAAETFEHAAMSAATGGSGEPGDLYDLRMIDSRNWSVGYTTEHMWHEVGTLKKGL
jgi:hypothetical protein